MQLSSCTPLSIRAIARSLQNLPTPFALCNIIARVVAVMPVFNLRFEFLVEFLGCIERQSQDAYFFI